MEVERRQRVTKKFRNGVGDILRQSQRHCQREIERQVGDNGSLASQEVPASNVRTLN